MQIKNPYVKNVLSALAVTVFGFILLNLAFLFDFIYQSLVDYIVKLFTSADINMDWVWYPPFKHVIFIMIIGLITWAIFRTKWPTLIKAIYLTVPLAVVLATCGMFLYRWPPLALVVGGLFSVGVLVYFYRTKQSWLYFYTLILISLVMLMVTILGVEI